MQWNKSNIAYIDSNHLMQRDNDCKQIRELLTWIHMVDGVDGDNDGDDSDWNAIMIVMLLWYLPSASRWFDGKCWIMMIKLTLWNVFYWVKVFLSSMGISMLLSLLSFFVVITIIIHDVIIIVGVIVIIIYVIIDIVVVIFSSLD